jgi:hypothetical protein
MKNILFAAIAALALLTSTVRAENCSTSCNLTPGPWSPLYSMADGFFQYLGHGTFSCSGSPSQVSCSRGSESYTIATLGSNDVVVFVPGNNWWVHSAHYTPGQSGTWSWSWDGGARAGRLTYTCLAWDFNFNCTNYAYGTCD